MHVHIHTQIYTRIRKCTHTHVYTCMAYIDRYMHSTHTCMYTYTHTAIVHRCIRQYIHACIHAHLCVSAPRLQATCKRMKSSAVAFLPMIPVPVVYICVLWGLELHQSPLLTRNMQTNKYKQRHTCMRVHIHNCLL